MSATKKISIAVVIVTAFLTGVFFTTLGASVFDRGDSALTESFAGDTRVSSQASPADLGDAFAEVAESVNPTVVQITSERVTNGGQGRNPFQGTPFEDFFGGPQAPRRQQGLGSGVIVRENGYIVTNNHVVEGSDELTVNMQNGNSYTAEIVGTDPYSDLAVIRIDANDLPAISFGEMEDVRTGQWVLAFGSPLSPRLSNTVTAGIISALGRLRSQQTFRGGPRGRGGGEEQQPSGVQSFIQTDAAINPGNSGGPLVNLEGELVGINSAIMSQTGGYQGIGFAIPVSTVQNVASQLIQTGTVQRARLGVNYRAASQSVIEALDLPDGAAQIMNVVPGSAADEAGIQAGDIIVAINGEELDNSLQLSQMIGQMKPGTTAEVTVVRNEEEQTFEITLGSAGGEQTAQAGGDENSSSTTESQMMEELGFGITNLTGQMKQQLGLPGDLQGVVVTEVDPANDAAREANLGRGAIIVQANRSEVANVSDFREIYNNTSAGDYIMLRVVAPTQGDQVATFTTAIRKPS